MASIQDQILALPLEAEFVVTFEKKDGTPGLTPQGSLVPPKDSRKQVRGRSATWTHGRACSGYRAWAVASSR